MQHRALSAKLSTFFFFAGVFLFSPLRADEILSYLPENTLSFALVRDVQATNDKIVKFLEVIDNDLPAPLAMATAMTGLSEGLDVNGDALFALLPAGEPTAVPAPMFLLPVSDYAALSESIQADPTGEICRVSLADEDVLIARHDSYALVMNVEHRGIMQNYLRDKNEPPSEIDEQKKWIAGNDVSVIVTSAGIKQLVATARIGSQPDGIPSVAGDVDEQAMARSMLNVSDVLPFSELIEQRIETAGLGVALEDTIDARVRWTVALKKPADSKHASGPAVDVTPLFGYSNESFALAGGGPLPQELVELLPDFCLQISQDMGGTHGTGGYTHKDWAELRECYESAFAGLRAISMLIVPVSEKEPLLSIFFARLQVVDSAKYLASLEKAIELANRLSERSTGDIKLHYDVSPITVAEAKGFEIICDLDKATGDGNNHIWQTLLTSFLGIDHKLSVCCCAVDERNVAVGIESKATLSKFIAAYRDDDVSLSDNEHVQKTLKLLKVEPRWLTLINPQGFVEIVQSALKSLMILGFAPQVPAYPTAPPLGVALEYNENQWRGELAMPIESTRAMAKFTEDLKKSLAQ